MTIPGYYTLTEAADHLGMSKAGIDKAAKKESWPTFKAGNTKLYATADIHEYRDLRQRTKLVKALGWQGRGLYRVDDIDIECPFCGGFAIEWPAPPKIQNKFMCLKGHEGGGIRR